MEYEIHNLKSYNDNLGKEPSLYGLSIHILKSAKKLLESNCIKKHLVERGPLCKIQKRASNFVIKLTIMNLNMKNIVAINLHLYVS